jgi:hypothetical protein
MRPSPRGYLAVSRLTSNERNQETLNAGDCRGGPASPKRTAVTLSSLTLNPTSVTGGSSSPGTVTLSTAAPAGGAVVNARNHG